MARLNRSKLNPLVIATLVFGVGAAHHVVADTAPQIETKPLQSFDTSLKREPSFTNRNAILMFDYQSFNLPGNEAIDLMGYHVLLPINNWLHFGVGSYAPVREGQYGGFMAFGANLHAQRKLYGNWFASGGLTFGGGGGGKGIAESVELSGTGGYAKAYVGLGYQFKNYSVGVNVAHLKFHKSAIDDTVANVFVQIPFGFRTGQHGKSGQTFPYLGGEVSDAPETIISAGLDNYFQIDPTGTYKGDIHLADIQYSRFFSKNTFGFYSFGAGHSGLPLYNQALVGVGTRLQLSPRVNFYGQLGVGSGGYAPALIDTGSGLLVYPKLSAEYMISDRFGLAATLGYAFAPDGTSKNLSFGLALNTHFNRGLKNMQADEEGTGKYQGYRLSLSNETKVDWAVLGAERGKINLLNLQADRIIGDHFYVPMRGSIAMESYRGYPGYGEISMGLGVQSKYSKKRRFQYFADVQAGANVEGGIIRAGIGANYELTDRTALRGMVSHTIGQKGFKSSNVELGMVYRFSLPRF